MFTGLFIHLKKQKYRKQATEKILDYFETSKIEVDKDKSNKIVKYFEPRKSIKEWIPFANIPALYRIISGKTRKDYEKIQELCKKTNIQSELYNVGFLSVNPRLVQKNEKVKSLISGENSAAKNDGIEKANTIEEKPSFTFTSRYGKDDNIDMIDIIEEKPSIFNIVYLNALHRYLETREYISSSQIFSVVEALIYDTYYTFDDAAAVYNLTDRQKGLLLIFFIRELCYQNRDREAQYYINLYSDIPNKYEDLMELYTDIVSNPTKYRDHSVSKKFVLENSKDTINR